MSELIAKTFLTVYNAVEEEGGSFKSKKMIDLITPSADLFYRAQSLKEMTVHRAFNLGHGSLFCSTFLFDERLLDLLEGNPNVMVLRQDLDREQTRWRNIRPSVI